MALGKHVAPELLSKVTKTLGITALEQWYYVSQNAFTKAIGARNLNSFGGTSGFLKLAYPDHHFDEKKLASRQNIEKDQKFMEVAIRQLFPNTEIHTKARKIVGIINPETESYLEIDFWIPSLKLGIEYQDKHHYAYQWYANEALEDYQKRDGIKKSKMASMGYTLITIGCWWDKTVESIAATIRKFRPELLQQYALSDAKPIPEYPPPDFIAAEPVIPGIAGIMSPFVPTSNFNPINWYAGEKYDGVRGVYNPELTKMFSRAGKELIVLPTLLKDIPDMLVEGELAAGRGNYAKTAAVSSHMHPDKINWPMFRYVIFDIPEAELGKYTQRYSSVIHALANRPFIFAQSPFRVLLNSKNHLKTFVDAIISDAGEGVIVQKDSDYEYGRAKSLAKIKLRRDADAQVIRVNDLSITCKLVSGIVADITFSESFTPSNIKEGDIVSYYHNGYLRSGKPKHGEIYKVRYDVSWEELVSDKVPKHRSFKDAVGSGSLTARNIVKNKMGHWNKSRNVRTFFDEYAQSAGFDPLVPENWYSVRYSALKHVGAGGIFKAYNYNIRKALTHAYPESNFDSKKFRARVIKGFWHNLPNVRAFLDEFARSAGFDPLIPENWYSVRTKAVQQTGGSGVLNYFTLKQAIEQGYPEVTFEREKFRPNDKVRGRKIKVVPKVVRGHWQETANVRAYFDNFAQQAGFDPLVPENWYPIRISTIINAGGGGLMKAYKFDTKKALTTAYPKLRLERHKFSSRAKKGHWYKQPNVRAFFDEFAQKAKFDPLVTENWYLVKHNALQNSGGSGLLSAYGFGLKKALAFAYPELKFESSKFRTKT